MINHEKQTFWKKHVWGLLYRWIKIVAFMPPVLKSLRLCWTGFVLAGFFFPDPVPEKIIPLGNLFSPNFGIFKVQGGCPMEKYSSTLGLQPKKSVEFLGAVFFGDLQRNKQDLGHWNFTQRCLPPWSQNWFWIFLCTMYAWGLCPFLGMEIDSEKSLAPRNLSGINLGTVQPPVGTTHGDCVASPQQFH